VIGVIAALTVLALHKGDFRSKPTSPSRAASAVELAIGCLILGWAAVKFRRRGQRLREASAPKWLDRLGRTNWMIASTDLCVTGGRGVAIHAYPGGVPDHQTIPDQLARLRDRFRLRAVTLVIDRGMVTKANLAVADAGFGFVTALKAMQVKRLVREGDLQLSLMDETNLAEIQSDAFGGERLVVCRNSLVGATGPANPLHSWTPPNRN
jgi:hypothetical protein